MIEVGKGGPEGCVQRPGQSLDCLWKVRPEDFGVSEWPLRWPQEELPDGGGFAWLRIRHTGIGTPGATRKLSACLQILPREIGVAGLKDRISVAAQWFSVPLGAALQAEPGALERRLSDSGLDLLDCVQRRGKLRRGQAGGNHFTVVLRLPSGVAEASQAGAAPRVASSEFSPALRAQIASRLEALTNRGLPFAFGPQRFGARGLNHRVADALLREDRERAIEALAGTVPGREAPWMEDARRLLASDCEAAARGFGKRAPFEAWFAGCLARGRHPSRDLARAPRREWELLVSAWQSAAFERVLARRRLSAFEARPGERLVRRPEPAEEAAAEERRERGGDRDRRDAATGFGTFVPSGPLVGLGGPGFDPALEACEARWLRGGEAAPDEALRASRTAQRWLPRGKRRALLVGCGAARLADGDGDTATSELHLHFALPPGAYASVLLEELGLRPQIPDPRG